MTSIQLSKQKDDLAAFAVLIGVGSVTFQRIMEKGDLSLAMD